MNEEPEEREDHLLEFLALAWIVLDVALILGHHFYPAKVRVPPQVIPLTLSTVGIVVLVKISSYFRERSRR